MLRANLLTEIRTCLAAASPESRVYIGCDSSRKKNAQDEWYATFITAVVIHHENLHGCSVFCDSETLRDYDQKADRPHLRMMTESYKAVEAYQQLEEELLDRDVEIHLDINDDVRFGSNCAKSAAVGYATGVTGRVVHIKPHAFAASYAADRGVRGGLRAA